MPIRKITKQQVQCRRHDSTWVSQTQEWTELTAAIPKMKAGEIIEVSLNAVAPAGVKYPERVLKLAVKRHLVDQNLTGFDLQCSERKHLFYISRL